LTSKEPQGSPKHFPTFDIIGMFITIFTKAYLWTTSGICWIQPTATCTNWLLLLRRLCQCPFDSNAIPFSDLQRYRNTFTAWNKGRSWNTHYLKWSWAVWGV